MTDKPQEQWKFRFAPGFSPMQDLKAENAALKKKVEDLIGFADHDSDCEVYQEESWREKPKGKCSCGLSELLS